MRLLPFHAFVALWLFSSTGQAETPYDKAYRFFTSAKRMEVADVPTKGTSLEGLATSNSNPLQVKHRRDTFRREDDPVLGSKVYLDAQTGIIPNQIINDRSYTLTVLDNGDLGFMGHVVCNYSDVCGATVVVRKQVVEGKTYWVLSYQLAVSVPDPEFPVFTTSIYRTVSYYSAP
jgi:hypothetical protein